MAADFAEPLVTQTIISIQSHLSFFFFFFLDAIGLQWMWFEKSCLSHLDPSSVKNVSRRVLLHIYYKMSIKNELMKRHGVNK